VKEDEMGRSCSKNGTRGLHVEYLMGKPEGKRPIGTPRRSWVDDIKMDLR
jgi:hypothetical protein